MGLQQSGAPEFTESGAIQGGHSSMARGEALVACPNCGSRSRIPAISLRHNNYCCSQCGSRIPLANVNMPEENQNPQPFRNKSKNQFRKRKRR
jgi:DNA-directed RNA polymerase subunit RPC12/RpoP